MESDEIAEKPRRQGGRSEQLKAKIRRGRNAISIELKREEK